VKAESHVNGISNIQYLYLLPQAICIGPWADVKSDFEATFEDYFIFPMGAVPKPSQPDVYRPTSDHTRTGFNAATAARTLAGRPALW